MVVVRCPCGRQYNVPEANVGKLVECGACGKTFVAQPVSRPASAGERTRSARPAPRPARRPVRRPHSRRRHKIGELAVTRGFVTREQLQACLDYQRALDTIPDHEEHRLGELLVQKRLISRAQLESLLGEQTDDLADAIAAAATTIPMAPRREPEPEPAPAPEPRPEGEPPPEPGARPAPVSAVTDAQRQAIRDSVQAAARQQEKRQRHRALPDLLPSRVPRVRARHLLAGALALLVAWVVYTLLPAPEPLRVLAAYLDSCDERSPQPDHSLALRDLDLVVRDYGDLRLEPAVTHDFARAIAALNREHDEPQWSHLLAQGALPPGQRRILGLLVDSVPEGITPKTIERLEVTVRPAVAGYLSWRRRGAAQFFDASYRFLLLKVRSPRWNTPWQVAAFERLPEARRPAATAPTPTTGAPTGPAPPEDATKGD